jgi:hypothetical protein
VPVIPSGVEVVTISPEHVTVTITEGAAPSPTTPGPTAGPTATP